MWWQCAAADCRLPSLLLTGLDFVPPACLLCLASPCLDLGCGATRRRQPGKLQSLNLRNNYIGDGGGEAFGNLLGRRHMLVALDMACNNVGEAGARALALGLRSNRSLTTFHFHNNAGVERDARLVRALEQALVCRPLKADTAMPTGAA